MRQMIRLFRRPHRSQSGKRRVLAVALLAALSGCAQLSQSPPEGLHYVCENDQSFVLTILPTNDIATVDIARMHFTLLAEPAEGDEERFGCSQMTLLRQGEQARFSMDAGQHFTNCRLQKPQD
jgi:hypothetical protein